MAGKFVVTVDKGGKYRFNLVAGNGQVVASSQGYESKSSCLSGCDAVKRAAADAEIDDRT